MKRYRKKPIEIEAFQFFVNQMPDWFINKVLSNDIKLFNCAVYYPFGEEYHLFNKFHRGESYCEIQALEGVMRANEGDWIVKGVKGELYPCKDEIFRMTYECIGEVITATDN